MCLYSIGSTFTREKEKVMSLEELMKPQDTPVTVGVMSNGVMSAPVYIIDFGKDCPPLHTMMRRYKNISLDIQPSQNGATYYVTSDRVVSEITTDALDRALAASPEQMLPELTRNGTPEFSSCMEVSKETDVIFRDARDALKGCWLLVTLGKEATEIFLDANDAVRFISVAPRGTYLSAIS